jgi:hypothetical protein
MIFQKIGSFGMDLPVSTAIAFSMAKIAILTRASVIVRENSAFSVHEA